MPTFTTREPWAGTEIKWKCGANPFLKKNGSGAHPARQLEQKHDNSNSKKNNYHNFIKAYTQTASSGTIWALQDGPMCIAGNRIHDH